jgi:hypothetical protein
MGHLRYTVWAIQHAHGCWTGAMQDFVYGLPRTPLPRTRVNRGKKKGRRAARDPSKGLWLLKVNVAFGCDLYLVGELRGRPRK